MRPFPYVVDLLVLHSWNNIKNVGYFFNVWNCDYLYKMPEMLRLQHGWTHWKLKFNLLKNRPASDIQNFLYFLYYAGKSIESVVKAYFCPFLVRKKHARLWHLQLRLRASEAKLKHSSFNFNFSFCHRVSKTIGSEAKGRLFSVKSSNALM